MSLNLIDFKVIEVAEEKFDKFYKLFNMTKEEADADIKKGS